MEVWGLGGGVVRNECTPYRAGVGRGSTRRSGWGGMCHKGFEVYGIVPAAAFVFNQASNLTMSSC